MDSFHRLQWHIMLDELREHWDDFTSRIRCFFRRHHSRVNVSLLECNQESEGRVWVEAGSHGFRLRVIHLHPANPSVSEALKRKCLERISEKTDDSFLTGKLIYPPEDDQISLSSIEDYWFNHWQGPIITGDSIQNNYGLSTRLRRSHRKSRRGNRCSICHKKLVRSDKEEIGDDQCLERDDDVLAHMPSVRFDTKVIKDDTEERSDDEIISKSSTVAEESISSATDDQLSRMLRVVDNELRTSYSLFTGEAVSQDVVDGTVCMNLSDNEHNSARNPSLLVPPLIPRQSRSCPCSPKLSSKKHGSQDLAPSSSPKSRSFVGISKFSLSNSLLAIHRQASNSLVPEFLKFDSGKVDSPSSGVFKFSSQRSSGRSEARKSRLSINDHLQQSQNSNRDDSQVHPDENEDAEISSFSQASSKQLLDESQSLPALRLSKLSLPYRVGSREDKNKAQSSSLEKLTENKPSNLKLPISSNQNIQHRDSVLAQFHNTKDHSSVLPDVVPKSNVNNSGTSSLPSGVVNLGFDGFEESSDFTEDIVSDVSTCDEGLRNDVKLASSYNLISNSNKIENSLIEVVSADNEPQGSSSSTLDRDIPLSSPASTLPLDDTLRTDQNTFIVKDLMDEARDQVFWWRRKNVSIDEAEFCLHQTECKVKQKPLLMFLHGIGSSADVWNQQLWYFVSCGYEVVAPDLLGHGMSSAPRRKKHYTFDQMLEYISLVFDLFVPAGRKAIVVGHNYGCALAVALTRGKPSNVSLLVLLSSGGPSPLVPHTKYETGLSSAAELLTPFISCGCISREFLYAPRGKHYPVVVSDKSGVSSTPKYVLDYTASGQRWPESDMAFHRRITIPVLLLYGMKDYLVSFVDMCEMEKTIPRAFLELIPGAGHEIMTDCPEDACHAIHRFIRRWKNHI